MIYYIWICLQSGCWMCYHSGWREWYSMIRYRSNVDVLAMLNAAGYSSYRMRQERILGERVIQKIRERKLPSWQELDKLCGLLRCHPVDLLEYIPDTPRDAPQPTTATTKPTDWYTHHTAPGATTGFLGLLYVLLLIYSRRGHRGLQEDTEDTRRHINILISFSYVYILSIEKVILSLIYVVYKE